MLYRILKKVITADIEEGKLDCQDIKDKLDIFRLKNRITKEQYLELMDMVEEYEAKKKSEQSNPDQQE